MPILSRQNLVFVSLIVLYLGTLSALYMNFPEMRPDERRHVKYPRSLDDAKRLGKVLSQYKNEHFFTVLAFFTAIYLAVESFSIPGSVFLTILSGYLFPFPVALAVVCLCSAGGATVCYCLSNMFGRRLLMHYFPDRIARWQVEVKKQRDNLFNYIVFCRAIPVMPNWFVTLASPIVDVPIMPFFFGTFVGVAMPSFLFIQAGTSLQMLTDTNSVWSWSSIALLAFFAALSLVPVLYKHIKLKTD